MLQKSIFWDLAHGLKLLEHIVNSTLRKHLFKHSAIHRDQHGFQRGLPCETQLTTTVHEWAKTLDQQGQTDIIFLDFSKAFDSVPHRKLLAKLSHYGIRGNLLRWMEAFLTNQKQRVVVTGTESKWSPVLYGVLQGTVLGPLMFLLYINDFPFGIDSTVKLFADDSVLYRKIESPTDNYKLQLELDLQKLEDREKAAQMRFEPTKCFKLAVTLERDVAECTYFLSGTALSHVSYHKYLGVTITETLSWSKHCDELRAKANRALGILRRNLSTCNPSTKERAYTSLVRPLVNYITTASSPPLKSDVAAIESIQRKAARFMMNDYSRSSSVTASQRHSVTQTTKLDFAGKTLKNDLVFFYKVQHKLVSVDFPDDLEPYYRSERLHHQLNYRQVSARINGYKNSFFIKTIPVWNQLPACVNCECTTCIKF